MSIRWKGDDRKKVTDEVASVAARALFDSAGFLLEDANRTVPHDEGTLARSGTVSVDKDKMLAAVSYDTPYAAVQHEDTTFRHDPGRRAKWLELTFRENSAEVERFLADKMGGAFK